MEEDLKEKNKRVAKKVLEFLDKWEAARLSPPEKIIQDDEGGIEP